MNQIEGVPGIGPRYREALELPKLLEMLAAHAATEDARVETLALEPATTLFDAKALLEETVAANTLGSQYGYPRIARLSNCHETLARASRGAALSFRELLHVARVLGCIRSLSEYGKRCEGESPVVELMRLLAPELSLEKEIMGAIISEEEMADSASPELADIRRRKAAASARVREQLERIIRSQQHQKFLQDQLITMRDGRFVVPVKNEYRNEIKGLVHDISSSGATLFIEPMGVVEANNEIKLLEGKERQEVERVVRALSAAVGERAEAIEHGYRLVVLLDGVFARAMLADDMHASVPVLGEDGITELQQARHPLLDPKSAVPIDIRLGEGFDTLVITGPNTGGKTVALKTLGLLTLMAMCGLMLPVAEGSRVSVFRQVLVDIGDEQSIEQSLSTFSGHMTNLIDILSVADGCSLVLLDELGAGTDPVEGAALAVAILETLRSRGCRVAATTHYPEIKMFALETDGVENASCEFDVATLRPTYRLLIGVPGRSNAFAISRRLGLPEAVIEQAGRHLSRESTRFEEVVQELEAARQKLEQERQEAGELRLEARRLRAAAETERQRLEADRERELAAAKAEARKLVESVQYQAQQLVGELTELQRQKDQEDFSRRAAEAKASLRGRIDKLYDAADPVTGRSGGNGRPAKVRRGDDVTVLSLGQQGTVLSVDERACQAQVQVGIIKTRVPLTDLRLSEQKRVSFKGQPVRRASGYRETAKAPATEFDMRGMNIDEGLMELDRFIDQAVLSGIQSLSIIHGKGTGALRAAVQRHLRGHKSIRTFRLGVYGEGESGVTIAELK